MTQAASAAGAAKSKSEKAAKASILDHEMETLNGEKVNLAKKYDGKVVLLVNVASKCGNTKQYKPLEAMHEKYGKEGLAIVGGLVKPNLYLHGFRGTSIDYGSHEPADAPVTRRDYTGLMIEERPAPAQPAESPWVPQQHREAPSGKSFAPIFHGLPLHRWRLWVLELEPVPCSAGSIVGP